MTSVIVGLACLFWGVTVGMWLERRFPERKPPPEAMHPSTFTSEQTWAAVKRGMERKRKEIRN